MQNRVGNSRNLLFALLFAAIAALVWGLYRDTFRDWWGLWTEPGSFYAHAAFVPFFVTIMIWRNREKLAQAAWKPSWLGLLLLIPAMALLLLAKHADVTVVKSVSFVMVLFALSLLVLGPPKTRVLLFPLMFILTMIPLFPDQLINVVAFPIQLKSTQLATFFLNLLTLHAKVQGTIIQMDSYKMAVEGACSGFKTLISLMTFSAAFAYLVEGATWKRWTLFLTTLPLSLLINSMRITFIGVVGELVSTKAAQTFHDWSGFIVLIMAFTFLFEFAKLLRCRSFLGIPLDEEEEKREQAAAAAAAEEAPAGATPAWWEEILAWRPTGQDVRRALPFVITINLVLVLALAAQGLVLNKGELQPPIGTVQVPVALEANGVTWKLMGNSSVDRLTKSIQDQLNPTRVINRDYFGSDGSQLQFFMTAGNARWTFHDPHNCSLGAGAVLTDIGIVDVPVHNGKLQVLEVHFSRGVDQDQYVMMYCYVVQSGVVQRTEQVHKALVWQTFFGDSGKQSYFLRFTQNSPGTDEAKRRQLIQFVGTMWDKISPVLTGTEKAIAEPPPTPIDDHM